MVGTAEGLITVGTAEGLITVGAADPNQTVNYLVRSKGLIRG